MLFDPFELDTSVTPGRIREALRQREFTRAILMAFRLNEKKLAQEALEAVPQNESKPAPPATPHLAASEELWVSPLPLITSLQTKHGFPSSCS